MTGMAGGNPQVAIIGGGIIGLAIGFELADRGIPVTILEAHRIGERAAAGVAAGMLAPLAEADLSHPELTNLALASHEAYPALVERVEAAAGLSTGYDRTGTLFVALNRDDRARIEHLERFISERGLATEWLTASEVRRREPALTPTLAGALALPDDHQVDPRRLMTALVAAARAKGGAVVEGARVTAVEPREEGVTVSLLVGDEASTLSARTVVVAGGAWTGFIDGVAPSLPLRPVKGQVLRLRGEQLIHHVIRTPEVYLVPRGDGELIVGATMEEQGFDARVMAGPVRHLLKEAHRVLPGIDELELAECNAGFRPALRDHLPAIGWSAVPNVAVATGHYRNGVELAPVTARLVADLVAGSCPGAIPPAFDPMRFPTSGAHRA